MRILLGIFVVTVLLGSCASGDPAIEAKEAAQARLLERRNAKGWTEVDLKEAGNDPILAVLRSSRLRAAPYLPAENPRPQEKPQEKKPEGVKKVEKGDQEAPPKLIAVRLRGMPLNEVVELLADPLGLNIVLPEDLTTPITVNFPAIEPRAALDAILANNGMELEGQEGVYRIRPRSSLPGMITRTYTVQSGRVLDEKQLQAFLTPDRGTLTFNAAQKTFVVSDEEAAHQRVQVFLDLMDRREPQVLIEAVIMEVQHSDDLAWGGFTSLQNINVGEANFNLESMFTPSPDPPFSVGVMGDGGDAAASLSAGRTISKINLLSSPILSTVSGKQAKLEVIERVPYLKQSTELETSGNTQTTSFSEVEFKDVGVRLTVTPVVGEDGIIEMQVEPEVLELVDFFLLTPVIDERRVTTTVYVRNNETLVIGGLLRESSIKKENKVPILGDIPILGYLFRGEEVTEEKVELLIFLTPHLVGPGTPAADGFDHQKHLIGEDGRFPSIKKKIEKQDG
jgi:type II secretory pathway component GspD/PulD (secretin)